MQAEESAEGGGGGCRGLDRPPRARNCPGPTYDDYYRWALLDHDRARIQRGNVPTGRLNTPITPARNASLMIGCSLLARVFSPPILPESSFPDTPPMPSSSVRYAWDVLFFFFSFFFFVRDVILDSTSVECLKSRFFERKCCYTIFAYKIKGKKFELRIYLFLETLSVERGCRSSFYCTLERAAEDLQLISIIKISLPFMGLAGVSRSEVSSFFGCLGFPSSKPPLPLFSFSFSD